MTKVRAKSVDIKDTFKGTDQDYDTKSTIKDLLEMDNIASELSDDDLISIGNSAVDGYEYDLNSRLPWEQDLDAWTKLALQISEQKTFPWVGAANIKFPLLSTAAMQFAARAYPTLVPSNGKIVKCQVIGGDPDGQKQARADRISTHMSYQVMDEMEDWEEDMDRLLLALPIAGTCFKKTYWDSTKQRNCSKLVLPKYLVVNYSTRTLEEAERISEVLSLTARQIKERINRKLYLNQDLGDAVATTTAFNSNTVNNAFQSSGSEDETTPYTVIEQHTYLDLDGDGYTEPYIVTVDYNTKKVLRIVPRYNEDKVIINEKDEVVSIEAIQYYTKYSFIPNPDGGFYDIGFGRLLGPINESANTILNQLVDAGSLSNLQTGFIGKGLRMKMGDSSFTPGEWKVVNATGADIKQQIYALPVRDPSQVLFNLLDLLLKSGKELASVAEIFVGKMPGQNTPATTTMATIEQGMKVFTAVYKRVYRSLTKEFRKIYALNKQYLNPEEYIAVIDMQVKQSDYVGPEDDVIPGADPTAVSNQEKQARVQALMQILNLGTIDPMAVTKLYLEAHEIANAESYLKQPSPPPPDPKMQALQFKAQADQQKEARGMQMDQAKLQMQAAAEENKAALAERQLNAKVQMQQIEHIQKSRQAQAEHEAGMQQQMQATHVNLATTAAQAAQKMAIAHAQAKQQLKNKPNPKKEH